MTGSASLCYTCSIIVHVLYLCEGICLGWCTDHSGDNGIFGKVGHISEGVVHPV